jgi:hypothetical protein
MIRDNRSRPSIMRTYWSDELRIMLRPVSTYRELSKAAVDSGVWAIIRRPLFVALVVGSFVSITVSGRLTISLLFDGMVFWSFVPILQGVLMSGIVVIFGRRRLSSSKAVDLFFMGHGPWLMWLLAIAATCLFFPVKQFYLWPIHGGWVLPVSLLGAWIWSSVTTFAFLRGALELSKLCASVLLVLSTFLLWGIVISFLVVTESIPLHRITSLS